MGSPRKPNGLGKRGLQLWKSIASDFDLRADEARVLEDACREADIIEKLEDAMVDAPLTVTGSMGQLVAHPLIQELRQHRGVLQRLLVSLKLPDDGAKAGDTTSSARKAAEARWSGRRGA